MVAKMKSNLKRSLLFVLFIYIFAFPLFSGEYDPVANKGAVVEYGNARFTVLTSRLIRMEWSEDGTFEDRATLGIVNRKLPVPSFKVSRTAARLVITTEELRLEYHGSEAFAAGNLKVSFRMGRNRCLWTPGMDDGGNLLGTTRTLDKFDGFTVHGDDGRLTTDPFDKGVVSRDGWAVVDESYRHILTGDGWVEVRPAGQRQDWYLFAYGHDYISAVGDFTKIAGKIPLPPKYAFGYWWSRYWLYNDFELEAVVENLKSHGIPADVFIIDMDWHETWGLSAKNPPIDDAAQWKGWTGYTWNRELFPSPETTLEYLHRNGFKTSLNLHPASGIQTFEDCYDAFVADYLSRTDDYDGPENYRNADGSPAYVPYRMSQKEWAQAYFNSVLHPLQKQGVDFWWLDWQQWRKSRYIEGLDNTFWLNHTFFEDASRSGYRPMIYHRWGGIGSHRYQVGFTGDTRVSWQVLSYMPWFISTSSNIGYGYWGQDIGGHNEIPGVDYTDPELFTRWVQEGVFTPIFKTHPTRNRTLERRFWMFPEQFDILKEAVRLRYSLSPYIYTAAREAYDTGISICRPMYYYYPESPEAYDFREQYFFGDDIIATVVCRPVNPQVGTASRSVWFPEGNDWFDMATGTMYRGGSICQLDYTLEENPWYVRASALLPMASPSIMSLQESSDELYILAVPGDGTFQTTLYEDSGESTDYETSFATTILSRALTPSGLRINVSPRQGSYEGILPDRRIRVKVPGFEAPSSVRVNGEEIPYNRFGGDGTWTYDGCELAVTVFVRSISAREDVTVELDGKFAFVSGERGHLARARNSSEQVKYFSNAQDKYRWPGDSLMRWIGAASKINENPYKAAAVIDALGPCPFPEKRVNERIFEEEVLGNGLKRYYFAGLYGETHQRINILEIAPSGDFALSFGYSEEAATAAEYGRKKGLVATSTATFGLPHTYIRLSGETISGISIDEDSPRWWMHEAAAVLDKEGRLSFMSFDGMPSRAISSFRNSRAENIVSSAPMLIIEGSPLKWREEGKGKHGFIYKNYPRTILAELWNGNILIVAIDGKAPSEAEGMSLPQVQQLLTENFHVRNALNLDGSAALYIDGHGNVCLPGTERELNTFLEVRRR